MTSAASVSPFNRNSFRLVSTCACTFLRRFSSITSLNNQAKHFSSFSTSSMGGPRRETPQKSASQDRKDSRTAHSRYERKRSAGFKGTYRHFNGTDTTFGSTSAAKIARKRPEFELRVDQTFSYVFIEFVLVFGALRPKTVTVLHSSAKCLIEERTLSSTRHGMRCTKRNAT